MHSFKLAWQLLRRDWRSGELTTLFSALLIAVAAVLAVSLLTDRLTSGMTRESAELIGGDLVISSTREPDPAWRELGRELGLATAIIYRFDSVLFYKDNMLLCSIKAVGDGYPLLGKLKTSDDTATPAIEADDIPLPGTAWVDRRVLERLRVQLGDEVNFGAITLRIDRILSYEPDQGNSLFQFSPRVMVNEADLQRAQVLGPGSRIRYRTLFHGDDVGALQTLKTRLQGRLGAGHRLIEPTAEENRPAEALSNAIHYLRIATLLSIVLAAITIALTARRYSERQYDISAMMRCLGAGQHAVLRVYLYQLLLLTTLAVLLAAVPGWFVHRAVLQLLKPLLPLELPAPGLSPWWAAGGTAFLLMAGFALPPVLRLADTPPLRVLRRELDPAPLSHHT